ncbi:MAG: signal peptidase II [Acidobacteria bacterium]|nr:signal peptidase II [Acidobacteriota bacterium]
MIDFLDFNLYFFKFPTFNLADTGITVGVALLLLVSWQEHEESRRGPPEGRAPAQAEP